MLNTAVNWEHFHALGTVLSQTQTRDVTQWNAKTYTRAIGWGLFFETVMAQRNSIGSSGIQENRGESNRQDQQDHQDHQDQQWINDMLAENQNEQQENNAAVVDTWKHVSVVELRNARHLIDRYILHSPYIDLNQPLVCCVLQRTSSKAAEHLKERYIVDTTLQVAHTINRLLEKSVKQTTP